MNSSRETYGRRTVWCRNRHRRRGAILILVAMLVVVFVAAAAFSVDIAYMQLTRTRLRAATDAAARAGGEALARLQNVTAARQAAKDLAAANHVAGKPLTLADEDIVFGRSTLQTDGAWSFTPHAAPTNSLRVYGRRTSDSPSGSVGLFFGGIFGIRDFQPTQTATVVRFDRDICLVADRSNSMKLDVSEHASFVPADDPRYCRPPDPETSRWAALAVATQTFLDTLAISPHIEHVALVSFASDNSACNCSNHAADVDQELTEDTTLITDAMAAISATAFNGATETATGIDTGVAVLTDPTQARPFARKTMVVFTDGHTTSGRSPLQAAEEAAGQHIVIHTITFGDDADQAQMEEVAAVTGGNHYHAPDAATLNEIFREIALSMLVVLTQ